MSIIQQDEERERLLQHLLHSDDTQREHIDLYLRVAVKGARENNWLCMRKYIQYYAEHESVRLGSLARFMETHAIEVQSGNPYNAVETSLLSELHHLCDAFLVAASEQYNRIVDNPNNSNTDKSYRITNLKMNANMCREVHDWLGSFGSHATPEYIAQEVTWTHTQP